MTILNCKYATNCTFLCVVSCFSLWFIVLVCGDHTYCCYNLIVLTVAVAGKSCTLSFLLFYYNEYVGPFGVGTILECLKYC